RPVNMTCPERAWAAILGVRDFSYHEWYNYEYYWTALHTYYPRLFESENVSHSSSSPSKILVLRTEHLLQDWSKLSKEDLFRQVNQGSRIKNRTQTAATFVHENSKQLLGNQSSVFWRNLCHAMCPELQVYKQILWRGSNLDELQVLASLQDVEKLCPEE
ncbi:MAG: hypothetical protein SGILL_009940, partial [Bacillariaceae sp.]